MNRRERRAAVARGKTSAGPAPASIADLMTEAKRAYQQGQTGQAEAVCQQILARAPAHALSLNLLGVINQDSGRHRPAVKMFAKAIASDGLDAAFHYNIGKSYQALRERGEAAVHFKKAIALGLSTKKPEDFMMQNAVIVGFLRRMATLSRLPGQNDVLLDARDIAAIADDIFFRCALELAIIRGVALELFLTHLRSAMLRVANANARDPATVEDGIVNLFCALAQQCFINEYVFAQSEEETRQAGHLRELMLQQSSAASGISPLLLAAVACYFPLHSLPTAKSLLAARWPESAADLLRQQVREPLEEAEDRHAIPALTVIDDGTSIQVMQQYEESPYPRWTLNRLAVVAAQKTASCRRGRWRAASSPGDFHRRLRDRAAGLRCGANVSRRAHPRDRHQQDQPCLRAKKDTRGGLRNIEYAHADILKLGTIGRSFDRIESVGVLHHLADPRAGWRVLLSLLKPDGIMHVGLYSETARRSVVAARALIAERGYRATAEDIRALRQTIIGNGNEQRWDMLFTTVDFFSMSGCRDLLFNVMEHRFTIPDIAAFIDEHGLTFLGFKLESEVIEKFQRQYPGGEALNNLACWNAFEAANPDTFRQMYVFSVRKDGPPSRC